MRVSVDRVAYAQRAVMGFLFAFPPLFFVTAAVLKYELGVGFMFDPLASFLADPERLRAFNLVSPILFLGGLILAIAINLYPHLHFNWRREDSLLVTTLSLEARPWNILVVATSMVVFTVLMVYAFLENITHPI